jgi:tetratricopeptide (TPR) repeat protein
MKSSARIFCSLVLFSACASLVASAAPASPGSDALQNAGEMDDDLPFTEAPPQMPQVWSRGKAFGLEGPRAPMEPTPDSPGLKPRRPPANSPTAEEKSRAAKAEALRKAMAPHPSRSARREQMLDGLFKRLAQTNDPDESKAIVSAIEQIWIQSNSPTADLLMERASTAMQAHQFPLALQLFDKLIDLQPDWAEAWNKRATLRFLGDDMDGAMSDIRQVLKLEPRHFGALAGMGVILQKEGLDKAALAAFRKSLEIDPQQPELRSTVEKLEIEVEGRGI